MLGELSYWDPIIGSLDYSSHDALPEITVTLHFPSDVLPLLILRVQVPNDSILGPWVMAIVAQALSKGMIVRHLDS